VTSATSTPAPFRVVYSAGRAEIAGWYARSWITPSPLWMPRLITLGSLTVLAVLAARARHWPPVQSAVTWALCVLAYVAFVFLYPQATYRRRERTLEISPEGVESWAGHFHGRTPWRKIRGVSKVGKTAVLIRTPTGVYVVPRRAFGSDAEMDAFYEAAIRWRAEATVSQA
jgi:hypothetical protein